jgi:hypothetical protein
MSRKSQVIERIQPADRICFISFNHIPKKDTIVICSKNSHEDKFIIVSRKAISSFIEVVKKRFQPAEAEKLQKLIGTEKTKRIRVLSLNGSYSVVENQLKKAKYPTILEGIQRMAFELVGRPHA